jgi:hypothetical protein
MNLDESDKNAVGINGYHLLVMLVSERIVDMERAIDEYRRRSVVLLNEKAIAIPIACNKTGLFFYYQICEFVKYQKSSNTLS